MPQGVMPIFEIDGKTFVQSHAIARFVARQYGMYGKNNMDSLQIDQIQETIADLLLIFRTASRTPDEYILNMVELQTLFDEFCYICNNDYGVNIGQVTSSRLCRRCTNLRILSRISGVSRNKQNESKISILGSQKSKKVTKILHSHQWNLYQFYQNKIL